MKILPGIDSLYYFCESNENYPQFFEKIETQLNDVTQFYTDNRVIFTPKDIFMEFQGFNLQYLGKAEGFYWFRDTNHFFKIGFKDPAINERTHNIRIQLLANGIYAYGLKNTLELLHRQLLHDFITGYFPITRIDLNAFVTYDFGFVDKSMFVTRKRHYATIAEIGTSTATQTLYVGKSPFRLRIYNKRLEMEQNKAKFNLMNEYFSSQGVKRKQSLYNVEFEMHRAHLRYYKIDTIEEALSNAKNLFQKAMEDIRLIDIATIPNRGNKHRAKTLPVWNTIKESYDIDYFLQSSLPLERIERKKYRYELEEFEKEFKALTKRGYIHALPLSVPLFEQFYNEMKSDLRVQR